MSNVLADETQDRVQRCDGQLNIQRFPPRRVGSFLMGRADPGVGVGTEPIVNDAPSPNGVELAPNVKPPVDDCAGSPALAVAGDAG